jgi:hypothetical protein
VVTIVYAVDEPLLDLGFRETYAVRTDTNGLRKTVITDTPIDFSLGERDALHDLLE